MREVEQIERHIGRAELLPTWWRHVLIAACVLVFSACKPISPEQAAKLAAAFDVPAEPTGAVPQRSGSASSAKLHRTVAAEGSVGAGDVNDGWITDNLQVVPAQSMPEQFVPDHAFSNPAPMSAVPVNVAPVTIPPTNNAPADCPPGGLPYSNCFGNDGCGVQGCAACTPLGPGDEYLCDGGDYGSPAGVRADWTVEGLEQEDAIAHYDTLDGRTLVVPSNRVCIYAPRFAAVRQVVNPIVSEQPIYVSIVAKDQALAKAAIRQPPASSVQRHAASVDLASLPPILFRQRQQPGELKNLVAVMDVYNSLAPYCDVSIIRLGQINGTEVAKVQRGVQHAITWTGNQAPQVLFGTKAAQAEVGVQSPQIVYETNEPFSPRLRLVKMASTGHALPGEDVEFTLRFDNIGDQVIGNVTIVDNLATRLEYVADTAKSTMDAEFSATPNEGGSTVLRWEITSPVKPGEGGILQFKSRVR